MNKLKILGIMAALSAFAYVLFFRTKEEPIVRSAKRVVIVGGGYAGAALATELQRRFEVTLVDTKPFFENVIANPRVAADKEAGALNRIEHSQYLKAVHLVVDGVQVVHTDRVVTQTGATIGFDYLVIATGSRSRAPFEVEEGAPVFNARNGVECEQALREKLLQSAKVIAVVGGGPAGVEVAAEIAEAFPDKHIHLVASQDTLLNGMHKSAGSIAETILSDMGNVTQHRKKRISRINVSGEIFTGENMPLIKADVTFLGVGSQPNADFMLKTMPDALNAQGYIRVNKALRLEGHHNIFAIGDVNDAAVVKLAGQAVEQAEIVGKNIRALENSVPLENYVDSRKNAEIMVGMGRSNLVAVPDAGRGEASNSWLKSKLKNYASNKATRLPFISEGLATGAVFPPDAGPQQTPSSFQDWSECRAEDDLSFLIIMKFYS
jgi:NADH dehydrogenase FAD-containing subunit